MHLIEVDKNGVILQHGHVSAELFARFRGTIRLGFREVAENPDALQKDSRNFLTEDPKQIKLLDTQYGDGSKKYYFDLEYMELRVNLENHPDRTKEQKDEWRSRVLNKKIERGLLKKGNRKKRTQQSRKKAT